jgi:hypothetical protein
VEFIGTVNLKYGDQIALLIEVGKLVKKGAPKADPAYERGVEWVALTTAYYAQLQRNVLTKAGSEDIYGWVENELAWAVATYNGLAYPSTEIKVVHRGDFSEYYLIPKEY